MSIFLILYFVLQLFFRYFSQFPGYSHIFPVMNHFIICRIFRLACLPPWQYSASRFYCFAAQHFFCSDIFRVHILLSPVNYYNLYIYHLESSIFLSLLFRWSYGLFFHLFCLAYLFFPASLRLFITFPSRSNPAHHSFLALSSCLITLPSRSHPGSSLFSCISPPVYLFSLPWRFLSTHLLSQPSGWLSFHHARLFSLRLLSTSCRFLPPAHILCQHSSFYYPWGGFLSLPSVLSFFLTSYFPSGSSLLPASLRLFISFLLPRIFRLVHLFCLHLSACLSLFPYTF